MRIIISLLFSIIIVFTVQIVSAQTINADMNRLLHIPLQYTILKTSEKIHVDGKDNDKAWSKAPWTEMFTDIVSGDQNRSSNITRCKLLWNDQFLYLYAQLQERDIRASIKRHDQSVYQENAFEMFIDPDGDTHNYFEFQINALGTTCDLFLPKPYRNEGSPLRSWDMKGLKKAIDINGTLNKPGDTDKYWSIELAVPFNDVVMKNISYPKTGTVWRMNFSRVEWIADTINGKYIRRRNSEHYTVWSPQGIVNLHYPERWGYVMFSDRPASSGFLSDEKEKLKLVLWKYYYLQQDFKRTHRQYAYTIKKLNATYSNAPLEEDEKQLKMEATRHQFRIKCFFPSLNEWLCIDQEGEVRWEKAMK